MERVERATGKVGGREEAFQTLTSPKIVFYATKNQVSLVYTTKMLDIFFQEHDKIKTQRSLHRMFIAFTRLGCCFLLVFSPPHPPPHSPILY